MLLARILKRKEVRRAVVFTRTKHRANRLVWQLSREGFSADAIHSNKAQAQRQKVLAAFSRGRLTVLVATDIVARGIDVDEISHVINYEMPSDPENYVHRVGRTARAGAVGIAISLCDASEVLVLAEIEKLTCCPLIAMEDHAFTRHPSRPCIAGLSSLPLMSRHIGGASARETARVDETPGFARL